MDNKREKIEARRAEMRAKMEARRAELLEKIRFALGKRAKAVKTACAAFLASACLFGCATSEPASRATTARYGDIVIKVSESNNNTIRLTIGDGALASADSSGSTETMTANPTTDVKPDIDVSVPVNKAGAAQSVGSALGDAVQSIFFNGTTATTCTGDACSE